MSQFIESIRLENGQLHLLPYHQDRMNRTVAASFGKKNKIDLYDLQSLEKAYSKGIFKCRVLYQQKITDLQIIPYQSRPIRRLKVVHSQLDYTWKYADRQALKALFAKRGDCDDVLIIKNGLVTDGSYTNVAFFDGQQWWTPHQPLLKGVQRQYLLDQKIIKARLIKKTDIPTFSKIKLFNAMLAWENAPELATSEIIFNTQ
ncbi:MAG: aminotransferase class IV [Bacteroidota bacterium]